MAACDKLPPDEFRQGNDDAATLTIRLFNQILLLREREQKVLHKTS